MVVVNLFGGPGTGKSTGAAYIFSKLKLLGYNAELVTEFAKDLTWENNQLALSNQNYVFGNQSYRLSKCKDKVDIVITDSPLPLSIIYNSNSAIETALTKVVLTDYNQYNNINFFLERKKDYNPIGRNQTEEEAKSIDKDIIYLLKNLRLEYECVSANSEGYELIIKKILNVYKNKTI